MLTMAILSDLSILSTKTTSPFNLKTSPRHVLLHSVETAGRIYKFLSSLKFGFIKDARVIKEFMHYREVLSGIFTEYNMHVLREEINEACKDSMLKAMGVPYKEIPMPKKREQKRSPLCDKCSSSLLCYSDIGIHKITRCFQCGAKKLYTFDEVLEGDSGMCPKALSAMECEICSYVHVEKVTTGMTKWLEKEVMHFRSSNEHGLRFWDSSYSVACENGSACLPGDMLVDYRDANSGMRTDPLVVSKFIELIIKARQPAVMSPHDFDVFCPKIINMDLGEGTSTSSAWALSINKMQEELNAQMSVSNSIINGMPACVPLSKIQSGSVIHEQLFGTVAPRTECPKMYETQVAGDIVTEPLFEVKDNSEK